MPTATVEAEAAQYFIVPFGINPETGCAYPPHPTQKKISEWVQAVRDKRYSKQGIPVVYLQHGVDSGGTRAVLSPVIKCLFDYPGLRVLIGRKDFNDLRVSIMETFFEIIPSALIVERDEQEHRYVLQGKEGRAQVFFRELKDVRGLGSQEFAIIVVAEAHEIEEAAYRTLKQRCRQSGYPLMILMEGNPPPLGHWLDKLCDPSDPKHDPDIERIILSSYENWAHMAPAYRTSLEQQPSAWRKRYLDGLSAALPSGTPVYPAFVDTVHVLMTQFIPGRPLIRGWDFGLRRAACTWCQLTDDSRLLVHREWMPMETPEEAFIDGVIMRTNAWFGEIPCRDFGDPAATHRDPAGVSTLQRLQAKGIQLGYRQSTYGERIPLLNGKLSQMAAGKPLIQVDPRNEILIEGLMGGYHYPELKMDQEFTAKRDTPYRDGYFEHILNAWEYVGVNLWMPGKALTKTYIERRNQRVSRTLAMAGSAYF